MDRQHIGHSTQRIDGLRDTGSYNVVVSSRPYNVDATDSRILALLQQNARETFGEIGRKVGLSAPAVKRRIDRLEQSGVIRGYTTLVDHDYLGQSVEAFAELRFAGSTRVDDIEDIALDVPEVQAIFTVAGDPDALAWIRVSDVPDLKRVIDRLRSSGKVTGTKTLMVLGSSVRTPVLDRTAHDHTATKSRIPRAIRS
jgi:Lrp/AsnC family transcriptional regulator, leucine-responsive regulatory protein